MKRVALLALLCLCLPVSVNAAETLDLQQCYRAALDYSNRVVISAQEIERARARYTSALGAVLPQISYQVRELLQDPSSAGGSDPVGRTFTRLSQATGAFNFQQVLFRGLQEYQGLKIAGLDQKRAQQDLKNVERLLFNDVVVAFYTTALVEQDIQTTQMIIDVVQDRVTALAERVRLGKSREGELTQEQSVLALLLANLEQKQGQKAIAYEMLTFLTGKDPMPSIRWSDPINMPERPVASYLKDIGMRPDLQAAETTKNIASHNVKYEFGNFLPSLDADANIYTFRPGFQSNIHWDVTFNLDVPLFRYQNFGTYKEAKVNALQASLETEQLKREIRREINVAFEDFQSAHKQYLSYHKAEKLAHHNFDLQNDDFKLGRATNLDVLTAQQTWLDSLDQRNRSEIQTWLEWTRLQITSGRLP